MPKPFRLMPSVFPRKTSLILAAILGLIAPASQAADARIVFGTGGKGGYYFRIGDLLCKSFAQEIKGYSCRNRSTDGPRENLSKLRSGKFDVVVARSDWTNHALNGTGPFKAKGKDASLRSLFSIHSEPLTILVRNGSGINKVRDLNGKTVRLGRTATQVVRQIPQSSSWDVSAFQTVNSSEMKAQLSALCASEIDAVASVVGYPSASIQEATNACAIQLLNLSGPEIERLVSSSAAFSHDTIPANTYDGVSSPTQTFGYKATLLSSTEVSDEDVYAFVKYTFENLPQLGRKHPALRGLQPSEMIRDGLPASLHPGAARYYREQGWIK